MKCLSKCVLARIIGVFSLTALLVSTLIPVLPAIAAIESGDYFQITAAGNATTMNAGGSLQFTVVSKDVSNVQNPLTGDDYAIIEIMDPATWQPSTNAAVTALGAGLTIKASVVTGWGQTTAADINPGTVGRNLVAVNIADGAAATNTFTVSATGTFKVFVWAPGSSAPPSGTNEWQVTVANNLEEGADHLHIYPAGNGTEVGSSSTYSVQQVNTGGGVVTTALTDAAVDVAAITILSATQSGLIESSAEHGLDINNVVKFTSAENTSAYYVVSTDASNTTFKVIGASSNLIFSNSNVIKVSGMSAGAAVALDEPGSTVTANTASVINTQGVTILVPGDIVSLAGGSCTGYYSVTAAVNNGADSTVTVVGPTACTTGSGNITKIILSDAAPGAYTVSDGAGANGYIVSAGGVATGNQTTTIVTGKTLTSGALALVVGCGTAGAVTINPSSATLSGADTPGVLTCASATTFNVAGYGPMNNQTGVPTMAPVDFMLNKDPVNYSVTFPVTNTADSTFSLINAATGTAVSGAWYRFMESWGDTATYRISFVSSEPLVANTTYTASVKKTLVSSTSLPAGITPLVDGGAAYSSSFTTGTGGGNYVQGGGFTGDMGGMFPPMAMLGYPKPGEWNVPTNVACIMVEFDRTMASSTLTTGNIYLKKIVNNAEVAVSGTPVVTATGTEDKAVCISGYTLEKNSEYRVVVTRDVQDMAGNQLAGMPIDDNGNPMNGFGFGFGNMGPFKESFHTTNTGDGTSTVTAAMMGLNLDKYKSSGVITGVPVGSIIRVSFNNSLNASTVNSTNVTLKKNGSVTTAGTVSYDAMGNAIEFAPSSVLSANTSYTFAVSTSVTSISGQAISAVSQAFTTGAADATSPTVVYADADNYGIKVQFDEPVNMTAATNKSFYTLKTCSAQGVNADGVKCADNSTDPTSRILSSGVTAHYEKNMNSVWMDGLTLTAGDGFYISVSADVVDIAGNGVNVAAKSWTGFVMDASKFSGGQGMFQMDTMGFEDFNMGTMGMRPINVMPMNQMAGSTTKYFVDIPISTQIPTGGYVELTFPEGWTVTGAKQDAQSPMNSDFNGPATGTITFATTIPTNYTDGGGAQANDGVGYITAARKVVVKLSAATQANDFIHFDLDGIMNGSEPKDFGTSGYKVDIKTYNTSNALLEAMSSMPFFLSAAGTGSISGRVTSGATGLNGVKVFLGSPMTGPMEVTTSADGAGTLVAGSNDGEFAFQNLPSGQFMVWTEPVFTVSATDYYGQERPEPVAVAGATTKNFAVTAANGTNGATQPVTITWSGSLPSNLGFSNSIDIFAGSPQGFVKKTISSSTLSTAGSPYTVNLFLPNAGNWFIGIGPAMPTGPMAMGPTQMNWMPSPPTNVTIAAADVGGAAKTAVSFAITSSDKTISGIVKDSDGTVISNVEIFGYNPKGGTGAHTTSASDGTFSLGVTTGTYKVGAFLPGMPPSQETPVEVIGSSFYVAGSKTASTGSSGVNPFVLKISKSTTTLTIQGRVSDGTNAIANAAVWAHRTDVPSPPIRSGTDQSGNYTLYVSAGTWKVEADAPGYGYLGSETVTVTTANVTRKDFEPDATYYTATGTINPGGTIYDEGIEVTFVDTSGNEYSARTDTSGNYSVEVPAGNDYVMEAYIPGVGDLAPVTNIDIAGDVNGTGAGNEYTDPTVGTISTFTVTLDEAVSDDTIIKLENASGQGNEITIPAGSASTTVAAIQGEYYLDTDVPGIDFDNLTVGGGEYNNVGGTPSTDRKIDIDGTGDNLTVTIPTLYNVSGRVTSGGTGINDALVNVFNSTEQTSFGVMTANNAASGGLDGEYLLKLPAGTYSISVDKPGYAATPIDVVVAANSAGNNFALTENSRTVGGTVTGASSAVLANAHVFAEKSGGGFASTETSTDGTYSLSVTPGVWTVKAIGDGYGESTSTVVDTTSASQTGKNFALTALSGANLLAEPTSESMAPASGGTIRDATTSTEVIIPPFALGQGTDEGSMTVAETSDVFDTATANVIGNGVDVSAIDDDGNPITTLDDDVTITLRLPLADLTTAGVDTASEVDQITNAYWDDTTNNLVPMPTTAYYYNSSDAVIPVSSITGTLVAASVSYITLTSLTDHFTTFAPVIPTGATPPATPTGLAATAGDGQVTLTWTKNTEADMSSYNIWEANVTEGIKDTILQSACGTTTCSKVISSLTNGTAYSFQIAAVDTPDGNTSAYCTAVSSTPVAATVTPSGGGTILNSGGSSKKTTTETDEDEEVTDEEATDETIDEEATDEAGEPGTSGANLGAGAGASGPTPFTDIVGHWAELYIDELYSKSVMSGASEDKFDPDSYVSRAEISKIVVTTFGLETLDSISIDTNPFKDVSKDLWYATFVKAASDGGLMEGYNDGNFKPDRKITRAEALKVFLIGALGADGIEDKIVTEYDAEFSDVDAGEWYAPYVNYAAEKGIVNGYIDGTFGPDAYLTRAEIAKIASKVLGSELSAEVIGMIMGVL